MRIALNVIAPAILVPLLAGCSARADNRPVLTKDVLFAAAKKCGAQDPEFTFFADGKLPSFSYVDPGPFKPGHATPTSQCLAASLRGYRFQSMTIETRPRPSAGQ